MAGTVWYNLQGGQKAKASQVMANFDWIEGDIVPMNAGSQTNTAYDLGSDSYRWQDVFIGRYLYAHDNIYLDTTKQLFLNGLSAAAGGTYFQCLSTGAMNIYAQSAQTLNFTGNLIQATVNFAVQNGKRLYLDGGGDTFIVEQTTTANRISFFAANSQKFWIDTEVVCNTNTKPVGAGVYNLGNSSSYWNEFHYHTAIAHSLTTPNTNATGEIKKINDFSNKKQFPKDIYRAPDAEIENSQEGIGINKLLSYMLKSIQELNTRIEELENA